ncbi:acyl-CoA thioesterase/bile acid-CoA:amino acid N-acyltransferase family protein [Salipaludibacillus sp. HK11]|uniref:acyl-CoA thioesterase/bile acid-CoA:amino acid N-acyltransferase family protein n=1 Tax=Salipaludibacillus sp. HK11 TaxID=3394320 RepID=UPI0039FDD69C
MTVKKPALLVNPIDGYVDDEITIRVIDCPPNEKVKIRAKVIDDEGKHFSSYAVFEVGNDGSVDLSCAKPIEGSYEEVDASGLFWSMEKLKSKHGDFFVKTEAGPVLIDLNLEVEGSTADTVSLHRHFYKEDVRRVVIKEPELDVTGVLYHPVDEGVYPGVLLLGGSDGGVQEHAAALLASKSYSVMALAYFGVEGVPKDLENIQLEYFKKATEWLKGHTAVNGHVSVIGFSRGGELALLLASTYDDYQAVIAGAPSAYVTAGMKNGIFAPVPSWLLHNEPLTYMPFSYRLSMVASMLKNWVLRRPISYLSIWENTLLDLHKIRESRIPVEKISVPVMTIAGNDDQIWPSAYYAEMVEKKLSETNQSDQNVYLYYKEAGHFLAFPYGLPGLPANVNMEIAGAKMTMTFGGSKVANTKAANDSWVKILDFLEKATKQ